MEHLSQKSVRKGFLALLIQFSLLPGSVTAQQNDSLIVKAREAIERGVAYFSHASRILDPDAVLLYTYLKDRYGLPELEAARGVLSQIRADSTGQLYMFLRLTEARPCEMGFLDPTGLNDVTLAAIWYDELEDPSQLMERIEQTKWNWDSEPYMVTHALWAVAMARHCFNAALDTTIEAELVEQNKEVIARNRPFWNDVAIEALAMAQYHDPTFVPPAEYIQELIELQNVYGSWNWEPRNIKTASQHTTVLALWALLQYKPLAWPTRPRDMVIR